jgi:hypothetical protein
MNKINNKTQICKLKIYSMSKSLFLNKNKNKKHNYNNKIHNLNSFKTFKMIKAIIIKFKINIYLF